MEIKVVSCFLWIKYNLSCNSWLRALKRLWQYSRISKCMPSTILFFIHYSFTFTACCLLLKTMTHVNSYLICPWFILPFHLNILFICFEVQIFFSCTYCNCIRKNSWIWGWCSGTTLGSFMLPACVLKIFHCFYTLFLLFFIFLCGVAEACGWSRGKESWNVFWHVGYTHQIWTLKLNYCFILRYLLSG